MGGKAEGLFWFTLGYLTLGDWDPTHTGPPKSLHGARGSLGPLEPPLLQEGHRASSNLCIQKGDLFLPAQPASEEQRR